MKSLAYAAVVLILLQQNLLLRGRQFRNTHTKRRITRNKERGIARRPGKVWGFRIRAKDVTKPNIAEIFHDALVCGRMYLCKTSRVSLHLENGHGKGEVAQGLHPSFFKSRHAFISFGLSQVVATTRRERRGCGPKSCTWYTSVLMVESVEAGY